MNTDELQFLIILISLWSFKYSI